VVGRERGSGKTAEINDEDHQQDFVPNGYGLPSSPKSIQAKEHPTWNSDQTQNEKRKEEAAIHEKRIE